MIPRVYVSSSLAPGELIPLSDRASRHLAQVLRLQPGVACVLFNGDGLEFPATIHHFDRRTVVVRVGEGTMITRESPLAVTLAQALCGGDKMDYVVRKAVELGVRRIVPIQSAGSVVRLKGERAGARVAHWQAVAVAACEQCGRNIVPQVAPVVGFEEWLAQPLPVAERWMLSPGVDARPLRTRSPPAGEVLLLVGPESGFNAAEEEAARNAGYQAVRLGPRVLRTETAALAMLAAMQALWGDF